MGWSKAKGCIRMPQMLSGLMTLVLLVLASAEMHDSLSPVPMRPPSQCPNGCALWSDLASDGNTRSQSAVNAKWRQGSSPPDAGRRCAMPSNDPSTTHWCYCKDTHDSSWGYCLNPDTPIPEQINLQYPGQPELMVAAFVTFNETNTDTPSARWSSHPDLSNAVVSSGITREYIDPSAGSRTYYMHFVKLSGLPNKAVVYYQVKSGGSNWSDVLQFRTLYPGGTGESTKLAIYGDMGCYQYNNMENLKHAGESGNIDAIIHLGDHAYNILDQHGTRGDGYFNAFSAILSSTPWVPVLGNHEFYGDYNTAEHYLNETSGVVLGEVHTTHTALNAFVSMGSAVGVATHGGANATGGQSAASPTASRTSRFYSVDVGLVHFIALDLNVYYFNQDAAYSTPQLEWLAADLEAASKNRQNVPWIVVGSHYPIYCTSDSINVHNDGEGPSDDPESVGCWSYSGNIAKVRADLEPLFQKHAVDVYVAGHEHNFESMWPILNNQVVGDYSKANLTNPQIILDPKAPVHFTSGAGGAPSLDTFYPSTNPWTRKRLSAWGYGRIEAFNASVMSFQQILNKDNSVFDEVVLVKPNGHLEYPSPRANNR